MEETEEAEERVGEDGRRFLRGERLPLRRLDADDGEKISWRKLGRLLCAGEGGSLCAKSVNCSKGSSCWGSAGSVFWRYSYS